MHNKLIIESRFCGPKNSGNGGYVCGMLANHVDYIPEITLRKPPPLSVQMEIHSENDSLELKYNKELIATVKPGSIDFEAPQAPDFKTAINSSKNYIGFKDHPYPSCFVCGTHRESPDALCIYPGRTGVDNLIAAPWVPDESLNNGQGYVSQEFIWSALDCPGGNIVMEEGLKVLLGRMTGKIKHPVKIGEECVVIGWLKGSEGRKYYSGTALYTKTKGLCAVAHAVWIHVQ